GLLFLALSNNVFAQDLDDVTITGKVADANGAAIVGASVTATLITTGAERTVVTDEDGRYRIVELKPGAYSVKAEMQNFAAQTKT
ncbi:carboxypeptidase-like regulatory domain-containing protein, partial [Escherichia coli]|uniref:carboxypeptidase-like regulatory domain-containing protein n=1 Tax=Escherichia coli TaxID=562 RepID=UPI000CC2CE41